jgi:hypothetical protein
MAKSSSSKGHYRSAITGRFVTKATAQRHPRTTVTEALKNSRPSKAGRKLAGPLP